MENKAKSFVALARLIKRHTFKENKWKAYALSGLASPWFEKLSTLYIRNQAVSVKIEVPLSYSSEFFIHFPDSYQPEEKADLFVERESFPPLGEGEFYICDLMGAELSTDLGPFRVLGFFENGDPSKGLTTLSLQLESIDKRPQIQVEVPLAVLKRKENSWFIEDIGLWMNVAQEDTQDEEN